MCHEFVRQSAHVRRPFCSPSHVLQPTITSAHEAFVGRSPTLSLKTSRNYPLVGQYSPESAHQQAVTGCSTLPTMFRLPKIQCQYVRGVWSQAVLYTEMGQVFERASRLLAHTLNPMYFWTAYLCDKRDLRVEIDFQLWVIQCIFLKARSYPSKLEKQHGGHNSQCHSRAIAYSKKTMTYREETMGSENTQLHRCMAYLLVQINA